MLFRSVRLRQTRLAELVIIQIKASEQRVNKLKIIKYRPEQRAMRPTYEAGLPARTQGAVGRVVAGLRAGGKVKGVKSIKSTFSIQLMDKEKIKVKR